MLVSLCAHVTQILSHKNMDTVILYSSLGLEVEQVKNMSSWGWDSHVSLVLSLADPIAFNTSVAFLFFLLLLHLP